MVSLKVNNFAPSEEGALRGDEKSPTPQETPKQLLSVLLNAFCEKETPTEAPHFQQFGEYTAFYCYNYDLSRKATQKQWAFIEEMPIWESTRIMCHEKLYLGSNGYRDSRQLYITKLQEGDVVLVRSGRARYYGAPNKSYYKFKNGKLQKINQAQYKLALKK